MAFHVLFTIAVFYNLDIKEINIKTDFFHSIIDQLLYMKITKKYDYQLKDQICQLKKALYGLKQLSRLWYK